MSILQQTNTSDASTDGPSARGSDSTGGPTVLEDVIDKATAKSELEQEISGMFAAASTTQLGNGEPV